MSRERVVFAVEEEREVHWEGAFEDEVRLVAERREEGGGRRFFARSRWGIVTA